MAAPNGTATNAFPSNPQYFDQDFAGKDYAYVNQFDSGIDSDQDLLTDVEEQNLGTNPFLPDTDEDGQSDSQEVLAGSDPLDPNDFFQLIPPASSSSTNLVLQWNARSGVFYSIEAATNSLNGEYEFMVLESNINVLADGPISTNFPFGADTLNVYRVRAETPVID